MIRALIVEDEATIRNGLARHVRWQELGIGEVRTAETAEKALSILPEYRPDLVLSDIRMPGMDGTHMGEVIRGRLPNTQIIFISGYTDKEYLQAAIAIGVAGYVEKPVDIDELSALIRKAVQEIRWRRHTDRAALHALITDPQAAGSWQKPEEKACFGHFVMITIQAKARRIDCFDDIAAELTGKLSSRYSFDLARVLSDHVTTLYYAILVCRFSPWTRDQLEELCSDVLAYAGDERSWFVAASREWNRMEDIPEAYRESVDTQKHLSYKGWNAYALSEDNCCETVENVPSDHFAAFYQLLADGRGDEAKSYADQWRRELVGRHTLFTLPGRSIFYEMDRVVSKLCLRRGRDEQEFKSRRCIDESKTYEELCDYVQQHIDFAMEEDTGVRSTCQIRAVCEYIRDNLGEKDLSLNRLAEQVSLSPAYLSSLFSKNMNCTVSQYVTERRMESAKDLLADPGCRLYEVAEKVGYEDPKYFSKTFKKVVGVTPREYRESL